MSYFFLRFVCLCIFIFIFLKKEFTARKLRGERPRSLRELFDMGSKWKKGSDPHISALLFASSAFFGFSLWESMVLSALNVYPFLVITLVIGLMSVGVLLRWREPYHPWDFTEALWALASLGLLSGAFFCWALFPWLYYRARFLKYSSTGANAS